MQGQKSQLLIVLPSSMWILGPPEQYNLFSLLPHREKVFALLLPHPGYIPHPISK